MCLTPRPANAPELRDPITGHSRGGEPPGAGAAKVPAEHEVQTGAQGCPSDRTQMPEARALYGGISWEVTDRSQGRSWLQNVQLQRLRKERENH